MFSSEPIEHKISAWAKCIHFLLQTKSYNFLFQQRNQFQCFYTDSQASHFFFFYKYRHHILKAIYHWKHYNTQKHASKLTLYSAHIQKEFKSVLDSQEKSRRKNAIQSELKNWIIGKKKFLLISQFWSLNFHYLKTKKKA